MEDALVPYTLLCNIHSVYDHSFHIHSSKLVECDNTMVFLF